MFAVFVFLVALKAVSCGDFSSFNSAYGGGGGGEHYTNIDISGLSQGGGISGGLEEGGHASLYSGPSSYSAGGHGGSSGGGGGGGGEGGDFHHGVSIVGGDSGHKGASFDLTNHGGGGGHQGTFGGSFVTSGKYEGGAHGAHKLSGHEEVFAAHYSDVLGADHDSGAGGEKHFGGDWHY